MDGGAVVAQQNTKSAASKPSVIDVVKVLVRLGPKQINDEIALATAQMKAKGMAAAIAAALVVVGLVFLTFLTVALIVAAIAGLHAAGFQLWAAALIVAGGFLLIALVFALIGLAKFKRTQPLTPEDAIRGLRLDLGVAREGTDFDPKSLDRADEERRRAKAEAKRRSAEQKKTLVKARPRSPATPNFCAGRHCAVITLPVCRTSCGPDSPDPTPSWISLRSPRIRCHPRLRPSLRRSMGRILLMPVVPKNSSQNVGNHWQSLPVPPPPQVRSSAS